MRHDEDIEVLYVQFGEHGTIVTYMEARDQTQTSETQKTTTFLNDGFEDLIEMIREGLVEFVDENVKRNRNPPDTLPSASERLRARAGTPPDTDE